MKKLAFDSSNWKLIGTINDLIDLVNSQQEAIEKLERVFETQTVPDIMLPATKKPYKIIEMNPSELSQLLDTEQADDKPVSCRKCMTNTHIELCCPKSYTHRTDKVSARDMASRNPSPEAKKALEAAVQQSQEDMNKMSTHRTVTLRIPKDMTVGRAIYKSWDYDDSYDDDVEQYLRHMSDTDLQKALDEVQPNE